MADSVNMKFKFLADASGIKKGASEANAAINGLTSNASSGLASLGAAFGIPSGAITTMQGLINKASGSLTSLASTAATSATGINASFAAVSGAIGAASAAVGVLAAGIASLNSVAAHYEQTMEGEAIGIARKANVKTFSDAINDFYSSSSSAKTISNVKQFFGKVIPTTKSFLLSGVGTNDLANSMRYANEQAQKSEGIATKLDEVEQEIAAKRVEQLDITNKMTEAQAKIRDTSGGTAERQQAIAEYEKLADQRATMILPLLQQRRDLIVSLNKLTKSSWEDKQKELSADADIKMAEGERVQAMTSLVRYSNSVNNAIEKAANSTKKAKEWTAQWADLLGAALDRNAASDAQGYGIIPVVGASISGGNAETSSQLSIKPTIDDKAVAEVQRKYEATMKGLEDINNEFVADISDSIILLSSAFGELLGDLAMGNENPMGNFVKTLLSGVADMAVKFGELCISTGIGIIGVKAALTSLNPYAAIAAGVALVALGSMVKIGASSIASGTAYTSSSTGSVSSSNTSGIYSGSNINITVSGTLTADTDNLVVALQGASNQKKLRT